tara:strand:- start:416 stop:847 length:432 start_codon:yes stop_codon:yes gene_type:complete
MKNLYKLSLFLIFLSCEKDSENTDSLDIEITLPSSSQFSVLENPLELVWSDEFDGAELNLENWSFEMGDGCPDLCGWGNNENQIYTDTNHRLEDGFLIIDAKNDNGYTSTRIISKSKQEFQYGRFEARIKVPSGGDYGQLFGR